MVIQRSQLSSDYHNIGVNLDFEGVFEIVNKSFPVKSASTWIFKLALFFLFDPECTFQPQNQSIYLCIISTSNSYTSKNWWRDLNKQQLGVLCTDCNESILGVSNFLSIFKFQLDLPSIHLTFHKFVHALCLYAYLKWPS